MGEKGKQRKRRKRKREGWHTSTNGSKFNKNKKIRTEVRRGGQGYRCTWWMCLHRSGGGGRRQAPMWHTAWSTVWPFGRAPLCWSCTAWQCCPPEGQLERKQSQGSVNTSASSTFEVREEEECLGGWALWAGGGMWLCLWSEWVGKRWEAALTWKNVVLTTTCKWPAPDGPHFTPATSAFTDTSHRISWQVLFSLPVPNHTLLTRLPLISGRYFTEKMQAGWGRELQGSWWYLLGGGSDSLARSFPEGGSTHASGDVHWGRLGHYWDPVSQGETVCLFLQIWEYQNLHSSLLQKHS